MKLTNIVCSIAGATLATLSIQTLASAQSFTLPCRDRNICPAINIFLRNAEPLTKVCPPTSNRPEDYANYLGVWFDRIPVIKAEIDALNRQGRNEVPVQTQVSTFLEAWVDIAQIARTYTQEVETNLKRCSSSGNPLIRDRSEEPLLDSNPEFPTTCTFDPNTLTWQC